MPDAASQTVTDGDRILTIDHHALPYVQRLAKEAAASLDSGHGSTKDRLLNAYVSHLTKIHLDRDPLPPEAYGLILDIRGALTTHDGPDGKARASIDAMSGERAEEVAGMIRQFHAEIG